MVEKTSDLRNLTKDELNMKLSTLKQELYNLRYQVKAGRIEKPHKIKQVKGDIARINTILREGEIKNAAVAK
jgi:large subunit ribosomal protein L29